MSWSRSTSCRCAEPHRFPGRPTDGAMSARKLGRRGSSAPSGEPCRAHRRMGRDRGTVAVTIVRLVAWDRLEVFAVLDALTLLIFLPAWPITILAVWRRRWVLAGAAAAMAATQVVLVAPELSPPPRCHRQREAGLRHPPLRRQCVRRQPVHGGLRPGDQRGPPRPCHAGGSVTARRGSARRPRRLRPPALRVLERRLRLALIVVASRYSLGPSRSYSVDGQPYLVRTTLEVPGRRLALWAIHTTAPDRPGVRAGTTSSTASSAFCERSARATS